MSRSNQWDRRARKQVGREKKVLNGRRAAVLFAAAALAGLGVNSAARGQSATWTFNGSGSWDAPAPWLGGTPASGANETATFSTDLTTEAFVSLETDHTIGNVIFSDTVVSNSWTLTPGTGGGRLILNAATPTITANTAAQITAVIDGAAGLTKAGGNVLTLSGVNTFSGAINVSAGVLAITQDSALGNASNAINLTANNVQLRSVAPGVNLSATRTITVSGANTGQLDQTLGSSMTVNSALASSGATSIYSKTGSGTLTLNADSSATHTGTFNFAAGNLVLGANGALGSGTFQWNQNTADPNRQALYLSGGAGTISNTINLAANSVATFSGSNTVNLTGTLWNNGNSHVIANDLSAGAVLNLRGTYNLTEAVANNRNLLIAGTGTTNIFGTLSGNGSAGSGINVASGGTVILNAATSYTGPTQVSSGTFVIDKSAGGNVAGGTVNLGGFSYQNQALPLPTLLPTLYVKSAGAASQTLGNLTLSGSDSTIKLDPSVALTISNTWTRGNGGGVLNVVPGAGATVTSSPSLVQNGILPFVTVNGTDLATVSGGQIVAAPGSAYTDFAGSQVSSDTTKNLRVTTASPGLVTFPAGSTQLNSVVDTDTSARTLSLIAGQTLNLGVKGTVFMPPSSGALTIGPNQGFGTLTAGGATANTAGELILINNSANAMTVNTVISNHGSGAVALTKSGSGLAILKATGTYTGGTFVNNGTLETDINGALGSQATSSDITVNVGGTIDLHGTSQLIRNVAGSGNITSSVAGATLTIGNNQGSNQTVNAGFFGSMALVKIGAAQYQIQNHASNYTGGTQINEGTLRIQTANVLGTGPVRFNQTGASVPAIFIPSQFTWSQTLNNDIIAGGSDGRIKTDANFCLAGNISGSGTISLLSDFTPTWSLSGSAVGMTGNISIDPATANGRTAAGTTTAAFTQSYNGADASWVFRSANNAGGFAQSLNVVWAGANDGTVRLGAVVSNISAGSVSIRNNTFNTTGTFEVGGRNNSTSYAGSIINGVGTTALRKVGSGTLTLNSVNTYTGATVVQSGALVANTALGATPITVNGGSLIVNAGSGAANAVVNGGALVLNNSTLGAGNVQVNAGGSFFAKGAAPTVSSAGVGTGVTVAGGSTAATRGTLSLVDGTINTLSINSGAGNALTLGGTSGNRAGLTFELGPSSTSDLINLTNASGAVLSNAGGSTVNVVPATGFAGAGVYTLIHAPGGGISAANFSIGQTPVGIYTFDFASATTATDLKLSITGNAPPATAFWKGDQNNNWAGFTGVNTNWDTSASGGVDTGQLPAGNTNVVFNAVGAGNINTVVGADFSINGLRFSSDASTSVTIGGTNQLTIGAGGIQVDASSGAHSITTSGGVAVNVDQTWANGSSNVLTVSAPVSGNNAITAVGGGTILLSGNNSYAGGTTIGVGGGTIGAVRLGSNTALGTGPLTVNNGTLDLNNLGLTVGALGGTSQGAITNSATGNATITFNVPSGPDSSFAGMINDGGAGKVVAVGKAGAGRLILSGNNTYSGGTEISGGVMGFSADAALGASSSPVKFLNDGTLQWQGTGAVSLAAARGIAVNAGVVGTVDTPVTNTVTLNGALSGAGTLTTANGGTLVLTNTGSTISRVQVNSGTLVVGANNALPTGTTSIGGSGSVTNGIVTFTSAGTLDLNGKTINQGTIDFSGTVAGVLTNSSATTAVIGPNARITQAASSGNWRVTGNGNIEIDGVWDAGSSNPATGSMTKYGNGTLTLGGGPDAATAINNQNVVQIGSFNTSTQAYEAGGTVVVNKSSDVGVSGATIRFALVHSGTLLYGSNQLSQSPLGFGQVGELRLSGNGVVDLNGNGTLNTTVGNLVVTPFANLGVGTFDGLVDFGNGTITNSSVNPATLTIGANNLTPAAGTLEAFTGNIRDGAGKVSLVKIGSGIATLTTSNGVAPAGVTVTGNNGNTFSGGAYVNGGTLNALANDALGTGTIGTGAAGNLVVTQIPGGAYTLNNSASQRMVNNGNVWGNVIAPSGRTVGGSGTYNGSVAVQSGGNVAPGASVGTMTASTLSLDTAGLQFEIGDGGVDRVNVLTSGGLSLSGVSTFTFSDVGGTPSGQYVLIDYAGSAMANLSNFTLASGTAGRYTFSLVNNTANTSVDLNLTATTITAQWAVDSDGNWSVPTNWTGGVPGLAGDTAVFGSVITQPRTVTVDSARAVGTTTFDNANRYTIAGTNAVTLDVTSGQAGINVVSGSHTISAPVTLADDATITVTPAASALTVSALQPAPGRAITKSGAGNLEVNNVRAAALNVNTGTVTITPAGGPSSLGLLSVSAGATLDLNDNDLVTGTAKSTIETLVKNARNNGAWNQPGITSTAARNLATTGLGVLSGAEYNSVGGTGVFSGLSYSATDTLVKYTWNGDANFDGRITFDDYVKIDTGFNTGLTGWLNGDFNYSGAVNFDDYVLIDIAFNQQNGTLGRAIGWISGDDRTESGRAAAGVEAVIGHLNEFGAAYSAAFLAAVPEPSALLMLGAPALASIARRRRRAAR